MHVPVRRRLGAFLDAGLIENYRDTVTVLTTQRLTMREMTHADLDDLAALLGDEYVWQRKSGSNPRSTAP